MGPTLRGAAGKPSSGEAAQQLYWQRHGASPLGLCMHKQRFPKQFLYGSKAFLMSSLSSLEASRKTDVQFHAESEHQWRNFTGQDRRMAVPIWVLVV